MHPSPFLVTSALTHFAVVGDCLSLKEAGAMIGAPSLVSAPDDSLASVATDNDRTFVPDVPGLFTLRFGAKGSVGWREVTLYAAPKSVETHHAYRVDRSGQHTGRRVLRSVFATVPRTQMDLAFVTDAHPWPLVRNTTTGEMESPNFAHHGG